MLTENKVKKKGEWSCNSLSRKAGFTRIFLKITYIYKVYCYKRTFVLFDVNWVISSNKRNWRTNGHCSIKQLQICGEENTFLTMFSVFLLRRSAPAYVTMVFPGHHRNPASPNSQTSMTVKCKSSFVFHIVFQSEMKDFNLVFTLKEQYHSVDILFSHLTWMLLLVTF